MEAKEFFIVVLDFNTVSVNHYELEKEEFAKIADEIDADDEDEVVQEFIHRAGHHLSEVQYMFSEEEIETVNHIL
jgi:hypothetical protein